MPPYDNGEYWYTTNTEPQYITYKDIATAINENYVNQYGTYLSYDSLGAILNNRDLLDDVSLKNIAFRVASIIRREKDLEDVSDDEVLRLMNECFEEVFAPV